ncbi:MAG: proline--tRNA ligase, partial [Bacteroidia bacterium]|nr:proline--tRNA ligase [Bacteroidia bacterium]
AKAFDVKFTTKEGKQDYVWATSWGVSTRLMGALIMTHSDDKGLVLPPNLAPYQVVIVPIYKNQDQFDEVSEIANNLISDLKEEGILAKYDSRDTIRPGAKFAQHELQGVPVRITIGPKDLENKSVELARRDTLTKETTSIDGIQNRIKELLKIIQKELFSKALTFRDSHTTEVDTFEDFKTVIEEKTGFVSAHWDGTAETEERIKELTKATIRCIPSGNKIEEGTCVYSGKPSKQRVLFAKAY